MEEEIPYYSKYVEPKNLIDNEDAYRDKDLPQYTGIQEEIDLDMDGVMDEVQRRLSLPENNDEN